MAISLPVLALYAVSAKMRGDRIEEQNKALADQEKAKLDQENMSQYIVMSDQGVPMLAPPNWFMSTSFSPEKIIKYKIDGEWQDWTPEKSAETVPIFWDGTTLFTAEEHPDKVDGAVQAGHRTINVDGTYTDQTWDKALWFNKGKTEPPPPIEKQVYSFTVNGETHANLEGQKGVTDKLTDLGIPRSMWPVIQYFSTVVKTDENENQIGVSQPTNVQLFGTPKDPVFPEIKTPFYRTDQITEDGTFLEVEQSKHDPKIHGNITGRFSIVTQNGVEIERTEITDIELANASAAIKQSDYLYSFKVGDETFGGLESISNTGNRILNVANQLNNSPDALKYLDENKDATNVIGFRRGLFADVLAEHNALITTSEEIYSVSGLMGNEMIDTVRQSYPTLLNIPGFKELVVEWDKNRLAELQEEKVIVENPDPENIQTTSSAVPVPNPTSAIDPTAADTTIQVIQHSWPKIYSPVINNRLFPILFKNNPNAMMIGDKMASRETLASMALDNFIIYERGIDGNPLKNSSGNRILSNDQPILSQFNDWANTPYSGNPDVDQLAVFYDLVDPRRSALNKRNPEMVPIARDFYEMTKGDIMVANHIVFNLMPASGDATKAINEHFGFKQGELTKQKDYIAAQRDVADSSGRAINVVNDVLETYYMTDSSGQYVLDSRGGRVLLDSTAVANLSLFGQGVQYLAGRGADILGFSFGTSNSKEQMLDYVSSARLQLLQKFDANGKPLFQENENGLSLMEQELQRISEITDAKYAERQFYTVVLAYEIAAAIQGGTGGRTISDQDVAMIMRGLRQNFAASPQSQVNTLKGVRRMLQRFKFRADALSSNDETGKEQLAYITTERILNMAGYGDYSVHFTIGHVVDELGGGSSQKPQGKTVLDQTIATIEDGPAIYNAFVLGSINERRKFDGNPEYGTIDEAKQDMEPTLFENLMETANRNFINRYGVGQ
jgi:hypothetical protein